MKQQVVNLIEKILNQTELKSNQLAEKEWKKSFQEINFGEGEIIFYCQETLIDILNTTFRQDKWRVPRELSFYLNVWRSYDSVPELVNRTIKSTRDLAELEKLVNSLLLKQKAIVFISNIINKHVGKDSPLIHDDALWMNWWQNSITQEEDPEQIINHCKETLGERVFRIVLSKVHLYDSQQLEKNINQRIQTARDFTHLENLVEELIEEILKEKKRDYIKERRTFSEFRYSLNKEEKELINKTLDLNDLVENVVPKIKEQQNEEEKVREEVISNLQAEFDRLGLTKEDLDKNYVETKIESNFFPSYSYDEPKKHVFKGKINSRVDDNLKTIEEVKIFEQEVKKHLWEKAKNKVELKLKQYQEISQKMINQLKEENKQLKEQIAHIQVPPKK